MWTQAAVERQKTFKDAPWRNEELNARFLQMFNEGVSFSLIASRLNSEFGTSISRNAAIGRAHRINAPRRVKAVSNIPRAPRKRKPSQRPAPHFASKPKESDLFRCDPVELSAVNASALHLTLDQVMHGQCRYPFGDGPFTFCGQPALSDRSYCKLHFAATHVPIRGDERKVRRNKFGGIVELDAA